MKCHWCLRESDTWVEMEGFEFCDEHCEAEFYADYQRRRDNRLPTLSNERRQASENEYLEIPRFLRRGTD